jgi:hypothetical protein
MMELPQIPAPRCTHLHSKAMAVHGEDFRQNTSEPEDGTGNCWCIKSARPLGPDNGLVGLKACSDPERDCYEEY